MVRWPGGGPIRNGRARWIPAILSPTACTPPPSHHTTPLATPHPQRPPLPPSLPSPATATATSTASVLLPGHPLAGDHPASLRLVGLE
ncbi:hypothetical protein ZWY2020_059638 [Hordeum vulgare]|nr:hypothetical protein ZWY2020_059638 [Hordeum vulgare]